MQHHRQFCRGGRPASACPAAPGRSARRRDPPITATPTALIGYVRERNYKGMTLESVVELENGKMVMVSEFFNEDDPDFDHSLDQKMSINWVESWEVVLADEEHQ
ncbi:TOBE domain-containing protein [Klebsiella pneumoniae subsp. pneumoniae]|nr:TOBE domain-containing protein [Klebsiella pneumoniae subsp. pneumoniae]